VCPPCAVKIMGGACPKHGAEDIMFKCRYCCNFAIWFCFADSNPTHFCDTCHSNYPQLESMLKAGTLPSCPAGPRGKQLEGACPLGGVAHKPTGVEDVVGCAKCAQEQAAKVGRRALGLL
jgi:hypothetical protein